MTTEDLDALAIPPAIKWAGGATMLAGLFASALSLQTFMVFDAAGPWLIAPVAMSLLGLAGIASGWSAIRRGSYRALMLAMAVACVLGAGGAVWVVVILLRGVVSMLAFALPALSALAALLSALSLGPARRVTEAREALSEQGLAIESRALVRRLGDNKKWVAVGAAALVLLAAAGIAWQRYSRPFDPSTSAAGQLLGDTLIHAVVDTGGERDKARAELGSAKAKKVLGENLVNAIGDALAKSDDLRKASPAEDKAAYERANDAFLRASGVMDDALRQTGLPVFVDADVMTMGARVQPILMTYYVERETEFQVDDQHVSAIHLWRLDRLRLRLPYLGYTRARTSRAMVVLDTVETDLVTGIGPALQANERFDLVDDQTRARGVPWVEKLETLAGERARDENRAEADSAEIVRLASLLARRRAIVRKWAALLPDLGLKLHPPERYLPEANYEDELTHRVPRKDLDEWAEIHDELKKTRTLDAFLALRRRFTTSVERHEVQHRLDYAAGLIPVPPALCSLLGVDNPLDAAPGTLHARARDELSAHLAQIGAQDGTPVLDMLLLSRNVFRDRFDAYSYAAWAALLGIGQELGIDAEADIGRGRIRSEQFAKVVTAIVSKPGPEIAAAARRFRKTSYGSDLPMPRLTSSIDRQPWRH